MVTDGQSLTMQPPTPELILTPSANANANGGPSATKRLQPATPTPRKRVKKPQPSFVTSLSFPRPVVPVQAAAGSLTAAATGAELKRGMRQSKVDALSKLDKSNVNAKEIEREREKIGQMLNGGATNLFPSSFASGSGSGTSTSAASKSEPGPARNPLLKRAALEKLPQFDLSQVKWDHDYQRELPPRTQPRMFDLEECPTFYPTAEEFKDPMKYMDWVGNEGKGKEYGIAKIVPPHGWKMPFELDTENFRFKTRLQRLNSLEASSRAKVNFLDQLYMFHKQQGDSKVTIPIIAHKTLDLWQLRKEVNKRGGPGSVSNAWKEIASVLGYEEHLAPLIKMSYDRIILPFDTFSARARSVSGSPLTPMTTPGSARMGGRMGAMNMNTAVNSTSPAQALINMSKSRLPLPMAEPPLSNGDGLLPSADLSPAKKRRISGFEGSESDLSEAEESNRGSPNGVKVKKGGKANGLGTAGKGEECEVCHSGEDGTKILLCDGCDQGYHIYCLEPPLPTVPTHDSWYCTACLFGTGNDFGFDEGEEHSLQSFTDRDRAFREAWEYNHPEYSVPDGQSAPFAGEQATEKEFWRLVESSHETVEVEYGADVHSTTHGSGAPTLETHPLEEYSADPWNLNNLPILPDSLLRYIKSDVSGMTVPWIYIGMMFSTFCWHNEDHHTYSINYMFWGETKTWYGIPGSDADQFEEAMKSEAPELFEQQSSLLYQLVTMMNPGRVKQAGVKVVACDQRPNEFVLTFPKAYHCGFNHGLNFNEAVNFALPDWLADGAECVQRYEEHAKQPVFSHDELLMTITEHSDTIKTALWIESSLRTMVAAELKRRQDVRAASPGIKVKLAEEDVPEEQYQCCACKAFCYLSQVTCACTSQVSCLSHAEQLCRCPSSSRVLRIRFADSYLDDLVVNISHRAAQPEVWRDRLHRILDESARPPLKSLRALMTDGEKIQYPLPELANLRAFVDRGNAWVESAVQLMARKVTARRKPKKGRKSEAEVAPSQHEHDEDDKEGIERTPAAVEALLQQAERLGFETPEIVQLRTLHLSIQDFQAQADEILSQSEEDCEFGHVESVFIIGSALNVDLPPLAPLCLLVKRLKWKYDLEEDVDDTRLELEDVERFISDAAEIGIDSDNELLELLRIRKAAGQQWKEAAEQCLAAPEQTLDDYAHHLNIETGIPTVDSVLRQLEANRKQAHSWQTSARAILDPTKNSAPKGIADIRKLLKSVSGSATHIAIPELQTLQAELELHSRWTEAAVGLLQCTPTKVPAVVADILANVQDRVQLADDQPFGAVTRKAAAGSPDPATRDTFTCYCRTAAVKTMATCTSCQATYHPRCIGVAPRSIQKEGFSYTCHMCEAKKPFTAEEYERTSLHELTLLADPQQWAFAFPPQDFVDLETLAVAAIRFARLLITTINSANANSQAQNLELIQHYIRKLHAFPLIFDTVNVRTGERLVFEEGLYQLLDHAVVLPVADKIKRIRARRPKFHFRNDRVKQSIKDDVRCICGVQEIVPWDDVTLIRCDKCSLIYHRSCVNAGDVDSSLKKYKCVACHARAGTKYPLANVRVQATADLGTDIFVDPKKSLISFYELSKITVPRFEDDNILILEMTEFVPGEKPEDRIESTEGATPSEASTSASKRPKLDTAKASRKSLGGKGGKAKGKLNESAVKTEEGTEATISVSRPVSSGAVPACQASAAHEAAEQPEDPTPAASPSPLTALLPNPEPVSFAARVQPPPQFASYSESSSPFVQDVPSRSTTSRPFSPVSDKLEQSARPSPMSTSAATPALSHDHASGKSTSYIASRPTSSHHEPVHRDSWTPVKGPPSPDAQPRSNPRYSPSWSHGPLPADALALRPGDFSMPLSRKRSLSPQPDVRRQSTYHPRPASSPRRSPSPLPAPLTFGRPKSPEQVRYASPAAGPVEALVKQVASEPVTPAAASAHSAIESKPAVPAAVSRSVTASPRPQAASPRPSLQAPLRTPPVTPWAASRLSYPSPSDRHIPGLPPASARPQSLEKPAAVRLDRWVG